jgi:hypothetical protein
MPHQPDACFATPATTKGAVAALVLSPSCERPLHSGTIAIAGARLVSPGFERELAHIAERDTQCACEGPPRAGTSAG